MDMATLILQTPPSLATANNGPNYKRFCCPEMFGECLIWDLLRCIGRFNASIARTKLSVTHNFDELLKVSAQQWQRSLVAGRGAPVQVLTPRPQQAQPGLYLLMSEFIALWEVSMIKTQWRMNIVLAKSPVLWFYCSWIFGKPLGNTSHHNSSIILNQKRKKTCPNQSIFFLNACQKAKSVNINNGAEWDGRERK